MQKILCGGGGECVQEGGVCEGGVCVGRGDELGYVQEGG